MYLLSLDSSGEMGSVCVCRDDSVLAELFVMGPRAHASRLPACIEYVVHLAGLGLAQLDGITVTVGPGSFTGVRVALSLAKGLAYVLNRPLVGISTLEALAANISCPSLPITAILDAKKKQIYSARFIPGPDGTLGRIGPERVIPPEVLIGEIKERTIFVGRGFHAYEGLIRARLGDLAVIPPPPFHDVRAFQAARLALPRFLNGEEDDPFGLTPHYIRVSDAEMNRKKNPTTARPRCASSYSLSPLR